jgi:hypothetical protein
VEGRKENFPHAKIRARKSRELKQTLLGAAAALKKARVASCCSVIWFLLEFKIQFSIVSQSQVQCRMKQKKVQQKDG